MTGRAAIPDRIIDGILLFVAALFPFVVTLAHRGVAPLAGLAALAVALRPSIWRDGLSLIFARAALQKPLALAALSISGFCLWIALGAFWSPTPGALNLALTIAVADLAAGALVYETANADAHRRRRLETGFAVAICAAAALLAFEAMTGGLLRAITPPEDLTPGRFYDITSLGRGVSAIAPSVFPALVIIYSLTRSRLAASLLAAGVLVAALKFSIEANVVALIAGGGAFMLARVRPRVALNLVGGAFLLVFALAPLAAFIPTDAILSHGASLPASWLQRLVIWRETASQAIGACFPWGCGADYARAIHAEGVKVAIPGSPIELPTMPIHPHNVFLQIWMELGAPGVVFVCLALFFGLRALNRASPPATAVAAIAGAAVAILVSFSVEASLWQAWRLAAISIAAFGVALSWRSHQS